MKSTNKRTLRILSVFPFAAAGLFLLLISEAYAARVIGLREVPFNDQQREFPVVQALPNYSSSPDCNSDYCALLFTEGKAELYAPRVHDVGRGKPVQFDLEKLVPYQVSDGSILYAPTGSAPTEYRTRTGDIRVQFPFLPGQYDRGFYIAGGRRS
jgi:hypothetical protein